MTTRDLQVIDIHAHVPVENTMDLPPHEQAHDHPRVSPRSLEDLFRKALETIGPERIVFGSDSSYFPRGFASRYLHDPLRACYTLGVSEENVRTIFGGNAARLPGLEDAT